MARARGNSGAKAPGSLRKVRYSRDEPAHDTTEYEWRLPMELLESCSFGSPFRRGDRSLLFARSSLFECEPIPDSGGPARGLVPFE